MSVPSPNLTKDPGHWGKNVGDYESEESRQSGEEMDERRREQIAYEYLCHLEEARIWLEGCIHEEVPPTTELEQGLTNGVILAKLAHFFAPNVVPLRKIFDKDLTRYKERGLHFRHTDNIMYFIRAMEKISFPPVFYPETTDIYDMKNMPRAIYCIHALSLYLYKLGVAPQIQDLYGKATFTAEEINAMKLALDKYGIQMPHFGKIGGILANEMSDNDAALHAAIIAINEALETNNPAETMKALQNPDARLSDLTTSLSSDYHSILYEFKKQKLAQYEIKEKQETDLDVYDRNLTQAEIQGHVNKVNLKNCIEEINRAINHRDEKTLINVLLSKIASLNNVKLENSAWYLQNLGDEKANKAKREGLEYASLEHKEIQSGINGANYLADRVRNMEGAVIQINRLLDKGSPEELMVWLQRPEGLLPVVDKSRPNLYMDNLKKLKHEKQSDLTHDDLTESLKLLLAVSAVNQAIDMNNENKLVSTLENPDARLNGVDESLVSRYLSHFVAVKKEKRDEVGVDHDDLNHVEIQALIEYVNTEVQEENDLLAALSKINEAISNANPHIILKALELPTAKLTNVRPKNAELYTIILKQAKLEKIQRSGDQNSELWHEEIQFCIDKANGIADDAERLANGIINVNEAIDNADSADLLLALKSKSIALRSITPECTEQYHAELKFAKGQKNDSSWVGWTETRVPQGYTYYLNVLSKEFRWSLPPNFQFGIGYLNKDEIQDILSKITANHDHELFLHANEPSAVKIQAAFRGYKAKKEYRERKNFVQKQLPAIVKIQATWKSYQAKKAYQDRLAQLHSNEDAVIKIQATARMFLAKKKYNDRLKYFKDHIKEVVQIQSFLRANLAHHDYKMLSKPQPPVKSVRKFLHLLEHDHIDFQEELELQKLKAQVVTEIRSLSQLENDLNTMDIKIGLLVRNRITLQDVVMHNKKLKKDRSDALTATQATQGIKGLSREKREQLEAYQHLFYLLQTNPNYLARLIFKMPQIKTTKFMESVILTLYNYAANAREEYLLLKMFETALREEIGDKIDQIVEIVTGNPTVIKMIVHFNRGSKGQTSLRDILSPLVKEVITDKNLVINTNPTEVYKQWINQMESETGKPSELPYDVDNEFAMKQPEVARRIEASVKALEVASDKFLNHFIKSIDKIPYGMRYIAMTLKESLREKFPNAKDDEILKVVGNLIYYRYMNPAIVAPDAFDIVDIAIDKGLSQDQRRNLGLIAKVLQYAASNKMFDLENAHMSSLNPYISESFARLKKFFTDASTVEDAESHFNIDQYSDVTMVTKPVVYMTVQEIIDTHQLLSEHVHEITSDEHDPLKELLDDLGDVPTVEEVVGIPKSDVKEEQEQQIAKMAQTEISLTLTNKFEVPDDDDSDMKALFVRTKKLIVDIMRVQQGEHLIQILETPATKQQESEHARIVKQRHEHEGKQKSSGVKRSASSLGDSKMSLKEIKKKIYHNLKTLEQQGLVSSKNRYQDIVNAIAKDIRNQRKYRQRRKQELQKLKQTLDNLNRKAKFYEEQVNYYNQYTKVCLDNLTKKKVGKVKKGKKSDNIVVGTIKYSAQKLFEKKVVLEIEGLPQPQFKNVMFEITSSEDVGVFEVSAKFMGVAMEKVELVFQDLLQLQYDGVAVMKMFGKAKINVNLLIFLINKKFYGK
ncbi:ras GTPase-activating-like protein IQGAP1 isoform X1 [Hydra vulgaris]|uniref:Ras GTPase-activating-like protein IQGAP1 isoform X1 n=1 Tax=Hydra vulgaris TaxID=6087 RepID=A0ABM4DAE6_HYDVU